jgi:hypothetical protein
LPPLRRRNSDSALVSICKSAKAWEGHILADRALLQQSLKPIGRDEHQACSYSIGRVAQLQPLPLRQDRTAIVAAHAGDAIEQFLLALALECRNAEHFAGAQDK